MTRTIRGVLRTLSLIGLAFLSTSALRATISVTLTPSLASPQPVGTVITWTATVEDTAAGTHEYQFSVGPTGGPLAIVKDFTTVTTFPWTAGEGSSVGSNGVTFTLAEGSYQVSVVAQNITNNTVSAPAAQTYVVTTRLNNGLDSITPTANPLVALFTAQKCVTGNTIKVFFQPAPGQSQAAGQAMQSTNPIPCSEINGANFYIAGMYPRVRPTRCITRTFSPLRHAAPRGINPDIHNRRDPVRSHVPTHYRSDTGGTAQQRYGADSLPSRLHCGQGGAVAGADHRDRFIRERALVLQHPNRRADAHRTGRQDVPLQRPQPQSVSQHL